MANQSTAAEVESARQPDRPVVASPEAVEQADPRQPVAGLFRDLRTSANGLSAREAARRQIVYGANELVILRRSRCWSGAPTSW